VGLGSDVAIANRRGQLQTANDYFSANFAKLIAGLAISLRAARWHAGRRSAFICSATIFCASPRGAALVEGIFVPNKVTHGEVLIVSPSKYGRLLKALNLDHSQIVEAALIRAEAIGRAKPHAEVAVKDQAECVSTVIASHGFTMRQTSFLALHLRSPFPR
jgi:hypothetical protein